MLAPASPAGSAFADSFCPPSLSGRGFSLPCSGGARMISPEEVSVKHSCPHPPDPLPRRERGSFLVEFAGGFAPGTPAPEPEAARLPGRYTAPPRLRRGTPGQGAAPGTQGNSPRPCKIFKYLLTDGEKGAIIHSPLRRAFLLCPGTCATSRIPCRPRGRYTVLTTGRQPERTNILNGRCRYTWLMKQESR